MTSTSVKDVSTVMKSYVSNVGNAVGNSSKTSFQEVFSNQTGKEAASEAPVSETKKSGDNTDAVRSTDNLKTRDAVRTEHSDDVEAQKAQVEEPDDMKLEEAMEVLATVAAQLVQEIADAFGMQVEEIEQIMVDMNMEAVDLLDSANLGSLLLEVGGAADSLALLTDENLSGNFLMLMNRQKEMFAELSETLQMSQEQLTQFIEEMDSFEAEAGELQLNMEVTAVETEEQVLGVDEESDNSESTETETVGLQSAVATKDAAEQTQNSDLNKTGQDGREKQNSEASKEQTGNLLIQNLKNDSFNPQLEQVKESTSAWSENTQNIMRQIMDFMKIQVTADTSSLEMQLHPASLGTLQVQVASEGGVMTANFIAENETVKAVLESQMIQLKESFAEQGLKVEAIEVTVQTHQFESNLEQGRGRHQEDTSRKSKPRRINLDAALNLEEAEALTTEEQLTAEMMTANGSTVDYTA